jgi:hypothetical protein
MSTPAGLILPTAKSYPAGAGTPRDAALMNQALGNKSQNDLNNSVGGKRRKHRITKFYSKGGFNKIPAPQFTMLYPPTGGLGTNPNDQIKDISATSTQATAWKANDSLAKTGGRKKSRQKLKRRKNKNKTKKRKFTK